MDTEGVQGTATRSTWLLNRGPAIGHACRVFGMPRDQVVVCRRDRTWLGLGMMEAEGLEGFVAQKMDQLLNTTTYQPLVS